MRMTDRHRGELKRRDFLGASLSSAAATGFGCTALTTPGLAAIPTENGSTLVPVQKDIEPLVRLIEETPHEKLLPIIAQRLKGDLTYSGNYWQVFF